MHRDAKQARIPTDQIHDQAPLRLAIAASLAFPDGSMTASGLRREAARGNLVVERIAGKDYTTLANIKQMRELCRVEIKAPDCGSGAHAEGTASVVASAVWIIIDGDRHVATGCLEDEAREAQKRLAAYITEKYRPSRLVKDIDQIDLSDVLSIYLDDRGPAITDQPKLERAIGRLNEFWGGKTISKVTAAECRDYVAARGKTGGARTDLETLRAAINHHAKEGLHHGVVRVTLPQRGAPRDRWLTRSEAAKLIWACWRYREKQTVHRGGRKGLPITTEKRPLRHLARFIIIGLYTGTRASAIAAASPYRSRAIRSSISTMASTTGSRSGGVRPTSGRRQRQSRPGYWPTCGGGSAAEWLRRTSSNGTTYR